MSAVAVPPTKNFAARPPIVPPIITSFNGDSSPEEEPYHKILIEDVRQLLRSCKRVGVDPRLDPDMMMRLIDQRKRMLQRELDAERMLMPEIMPPALMAAFPQEFAWDESDVVQTYIRLLSELDSAAERINTEFRAKNMPLPTSQN
jgi:hypothetical protein